MKNEIGAGEFKAKCLRTLDEVQRSRRELVITKRGLPVARLLPVGSSRAPLLGRMEGSLEILGDIVAPLAETWDAGD